MPSRDFRIQQQSNYENPADAEERKTAYSAVNIVSSRQRAKFSTFTTRSPNFLVQLMKICSDIYTSSTRSVLCTKPQTKKT